jgi:hypothetical protein
MITHIALWLASDCGDVSVFEGPTAVQVVPGFGHKQPNMYRQPGALGVGAPTSVLCLARGDSLSFVATGATSWRTTGAEKGESASYNAGFRV